MKRLLLPLVLLLASPAARAEGPVQPPRGGDPIDEIKKAAVRITNAMKESEAALTRVARGETAEPKPVDVALPPPKPSPTTQDSDPAGGT